MSHMNCCTPSPTSKRPFLCYVSFRLVCMVATGSPSRSGLMDKKIPTRFSSGCSVLALYGSLPENVHVADYVLLGCGAKPGHTIPLQLFLIMMTLPALLLSTLPTEDEVMAICLPSMLPTAPLTLTTSRVLKQANYDRTKKWLVSSLLECWHAKSASCG